MERCVNFYNIVPVKAEPSDKAEMVTQLLFGERYLTLEVSENGKWTKIESDYDEYQGWIDTHLVNSVSEDDWHKIINTESTFCTEPSASILNKNGFFSPVTFGADLSCLSIDPRKRMFSNMDRVIEVEEIPGIAKSFLDTPYLWGGKTHFGIDCSGFVQQVYKVAGIPISRDAYQQAEEGELISYDEREPGDLVFFENDEGRIHHVGIILERKKMIHAHGRVRFDKVDETGIFNQDTEDYSHKYAFIRRFF